MTLARKLGIAVFCGVPAIVGGGIAYALFNESYIAVAVWETILLLAAGAWISK